MSRGSLSRSHNTCPKCGGYKLKQSRGHPTEMCWECYKKYKLKPKINWRKVKTPPEIKKILKSKSLKVTKSYRK